MSFEEFPFAQVPKEVSEIIERERLTAAGVQEVRLQILNIVKLAEMPNLSGLPALIGAKKPSAKRGSALILGDVHADTEVHRDSLIMGGVIAPTSRSGFELTSFGRHVDLVYTGDLADRGPSTTGVYDTILELWRQGLKKEKTHLVLGNHDSRVFRILQAVAENYDSVTQSLIEDWKRRDVGGANFIENMRKEYFAGNPSTSDLQILLKAYEVFLKPNGVYRSVVDHFTPLYQQDDVLVIHGGIGLDGYQLLQEMGGVEGVNNLVSYFRQSGNFLDIDRGMRSFTWYKNDERFPALPVEGAQYLEEMGVGLIVHGHQVKREKPSLRWEHEKIAVMGVDLAMAKALTSGGNPSGVLIASNGNVTSFSRLYGVDHVASLATIPFVGETVSLFLSDAEEMRIESGWTVERVDSDNQVHLTAVNQQSQEQVRFSCSFEDFFYAQKIAQHVLRTV